MDLYRQVYPGKENEEIKFPDIGRSAGMNASRVSIVVAAEDQTHPIFLVGDGSDRGRPGKYITSEVDDERVYTVSEPSTLTEIYDILDACVDNGIHETEEEHDVRVIGRKWKCDLENNRSFPYRSFNNRRYSHLSFNNRSFSHRPFNNPNDYDQDFMPSGNLNLIANLVTQTSDFRLWQATFDISEWKQFNLGGHKPPIPAAIRSLTVASQPTDHKPSLSLPTLFKSWSGPNLLSPTEVYTDADAESFVSRLVNGHVSKTDGVFAPNLFSWCGQLPTIEGFYGYAYRGAFDPTEWLPIKYSTTAINAGGNETAASFGYPLYKDQTAEHPFRLSGPRLLRALRLSAPETSQLGSRLQHVVNDIGWLRSHGHPIVVFEDTNDVPRASGRPVTCTNIATNFFDSGEVSRFEKAAKEALTPASAGNLEQSDAVEKWRILLKSTGQSTPHSIFIYDSASRSPGELERALQACQIAIRDIPKPFTAAIVVPRGENLSSRLLLELFDARTATDPCLNDGVSAFTSLPWDDSSSSTGGSTIDIRKQLFEQAHITSLAASVAETTAADQLPDPFATLVDAYPQTVANATQLVAVDKISPTGFFNLQTESLVVPTKRNATMQLSKPAELSEALHRVDDLASFVDAQYSTEPNDSGETDPTPATATGVTERHETTDKTSTDDTKSPWEEIYYPPEDALPQHLHLNREEELMYCSLCGKELQLPPKEKGALPLKSILTCCASLEDADLERIRAPAVPAINQITVAQQEASAECCVFAAVLHRIMARDCDPKLEFAFTDSMTTIRDYVGVAESEIKRFSTAADHPAVDEPWFSIQQGRRKFYTLRPAGRKALNLPWKRGVHWGDGINDLHQTTVHIAGVSFLATAITDHHPTVSYHKKYVDANPAVNDWLPSDIQERLGDVTDTDTSTAQRYDVVYFDSADKPTVLGEFERDNNDIDGLLTDQRQMKVLADEFGADIIYGVPNKSTADKIIADLADEYDSCMPLTRHTKGTNLYRTNSRLLKLDDPPVTAIETSSHLREMQQHDTLGAKNAETFKARLITWYDEKYN